MGRSVRGQFEKYGMSLTILLGKVMCVKIYAIESNISV